MTGKEVKTMIISSGIRCWQVAEKLNLSDGNFSRRLRKPFNDDEILIIQNILQKFREESGENDRQEH